MQGIRAGQRGWVARNTIIAVLPFLGGLLALLFSVTTCRADEAQMELARRIDGLISVFNDPEARGQHRHLSRRAIKELAAIGEPAVPKLMKAKLGPDGPVAEFSSAALYKMGGKAVPQVRVEWQELKESDRWRFMGFLGKYDYKASLGFALASLASKDENVRRQAIRYCGQHKEVKAREILLNGLNAEIPSLRWDVVDPLTKIGGEKVIDAFISLLSCKSWAARGEGLDPPPGPAPPWWPDGRPRIIDALRKLKAKQSAPALLKVLAEKGRGKAYLASFIIPVLGQFRYKESVPELKRIIAARPKDLVLSVDKPTEIKALAAKALIKIRCNSK
jgi:HEAT repeat protein